MDKIIASTYEVIEKIGSGGGGVVYLANHIRLNKKVVLKADKRKITTRPEILRREVDALKNLNHTYIPQVYDFFAEDDTVYTVIDYIEGESLDRPLKIGERFSQPQVIKWAVQLLEALAYLHKPIHGTPPRGIVHSDIKPANIMLKSNGDICLIDFNIALALGEENVVGLSAGYASPEHYGLDFSRDTSFTSGSSSRSLNKASVEKSSQDDATKTMPSDTTRTMARDDEEKVTVTMSMKPIGTGSVSSPKKIVVPDARSDIYSLGATLYHLISGIRPARNAAEVTPLSGEGISPLVAEIIKKAMNPNPDMRYQSAEEMLWDFIHLRENDPRTIRRKKIRNTTIAIITVFMIASLFTSFTGLKRMEAEKSALALAANSKNALESGNPDYATELALKALPKSGIFTPEYTAEAEKALADSLGVYDLSDSYRAYHNVELPSEAFKICISPDGKTGIALYSFAAEIFDTETGKIKTELPLIQSALADAVFIDDQHIAYAGDKGLTLYDITNDVSLWTGESVTHIAVSSDGQTIVGIYKNDDNAYIYDIDGNQKTIVEFGGKKQRVVDNDIFADPMDNLLKLSRDGKYMAVSFDDGSLTLFNTENPDDSITIFENSEYTHFEGGFYENYFAFSGTNENESEFIIVDIQNAIITQDFVTDGKITVKTDKEGIYLSNLSTAVKIDPVTGEQKELAFADSDIKDFSVYKEKILVLTEKNECLFYKDGGRLFSKISPTQANFDFVDISADFAIAAGRNEPGVNIFKAKSNAEAEIAVYDKADIHDEARVNADRKKIMLFDYKGFRLYTADGELIKSVQLPNTEKVYDQQYSNKSGNLAVMYNDAFRLYSGEDGELIYEAEELKSVFYAPYGVSIYTKKGELKLIDLDKAEELLSENVQGDYAAYCGMIVDSEFLNSRKLIGAGKTERGYYFAVADDESCYVYFQDGTELFKIPVSENTEAFFTDTEIIISPTHGTPEVYRLKDGSKVADLEADAYLTYITDADNYIVSQYISTTEGVYGILLDKKTYKPLAYLPGLADIQDNKFIFDYNDGSLRCSPIYTIDELIIMAKGGKIT